MTIEDQVKEAIEEFGASAYKRFAVTCKDGGSILVVLSNGHLIDLMNEGGRFVIEKSEHNL